MLFTAIGTMLGATVAASAGAGIGAFGVGVAATALGAGLAGSSIYSSSQANKKQDSPALPQSPTVKASETVAKATAKKKQIAMGRSESIYTSPLGIGQQAEINQKTLLGQ